MPRQKRVAQGLGRGGAEGPAVRLRGELSLAKLLGHKPKKKRGSGTWPRVLAGGWGQRRGGCNVNSNKKLAQNSAPPKFLH